VVQPKGAAAQQGIAAVGMELAGSSLRSLADLAGPQQNSETLDGSATRRSSPPSREGLLSAVLPVLDAVQA